MDSRLAHRLGRRHTAVALPCVSWSIRGGGPPAPPQSPKPPTSWGFSTSPLPLGSGVPKAQPSLDTPPPPLHLYCPTQDPDPATDVPWGESRRPSLLASASRCPVEWLLGTWMTSGPSPSGLPFLTREVKELAPLEEGEPRVRGTYVHQVFYVHHLLFRKQGQTGSDMPKATQLGCGSRRI